MPDERQVDRYQVRADSKGWTVYEVWSGEPALIASKPQVGLSEDDARHTASMLNQRARRGDSSMRS
ncbi:MAG: hypothetical protein JSR98_19730 [Proteobacteria bacterium]|nr:hypothetical protein [Pseudomonadota bacterium]